MQGTKDTPEPSALDAASAQRLESWKEIAVHLRHSVRTVKRWEKIEAMPVHRHAHNKLSSVYAYKSEIDAWWAARSSGPRWLPSNSNEARSFVQVAQSQVLKRVPCVLTAASVILLFNLLLRLLASR